MEWVAESLFFSLVLKICILVYPKHYKNHKAFGELCTQICTSLLIKVPLSLNTPTVCPAFGPLQISTLPSPCTGSSHSSGYLPRIAKPLFLELSLATLRGTSEFDIEVKTISGKLCGLFPINKLMRSQDSFKIARGNMGLRVLLRQTLSICYLCTLTDASCST